MNDSTVPENRTEYYSVLGLPPGASIVQVRAQFRRLAKRFHPDITGGDARHQEQFRSLHGAYKFLADPKRKADYDTRFQEPPCPAGKDTACAEPLDRSASPWIHTGLGTPVVLDTKKVSRTGRRGSPPRAFRAWLAAGLTWALATCAVSLMVLMMRAPQGSISPTRASTSSFPVTPPHPHSVSEDAPVTANVFGTPDPVWGAPRTQSTEPAGAAVLSHDASRDVPDPVVDPRYQIDPKYMVDSKYTKIDTQYTAVDPGYLTVDTHVTSVDAHITGVDPRYTSIDPKLITP